MPTFEEHSRDSEARFGHAYPEIHRWLDEFHGHPDYKTRHRRVRHHEAGIAEAIRHFGDHAGPVARAHIELDLRREGWTEADPFPQDEAHFVAMGLW